MWLGRPSSHSSYREFTKSPFATVTIAGTSSLCDSLQASQLCLLNLGIAIFQFAQKTEGCCEPFLAFVLPHWYPRPPQSVISTMRPLVFRETALIPPSLSWWTILLQATYPSIQDATHQLSLFLGICLSCFSTCWVPHLPLGSRSTMRIFRRCYIILQTYEASVVLKYSSIPFKINNSRHLGGPPGTSADSDY